MAGATPADRVKGPSTLIELSKFDRCKPELGGSEKAANIHVHLRWLHEALDTGPYLLSVRGNTDAGTLLVWPHRYRDHQALGGRRDWDAQLVFPGLRVVALDEGEAFFPNFVGILSRAKQAFNQSRSRPKGHDLRITFADPMTQDIARSISSLSMLRTIGGRFTGSTNDRDR